MLPHGVGEKNKEDIFAKKKKMLSHMIILIMPEGTYFFILTPRDGCTHSIQFDDCMRSHHFLVQPTTWFNFRKKKIRGFPFLRCTRSFRVTFPSRINFFYTFLRCARACLMTSKHLLLCLKNAPSTLGTPFPNALDALPQD